MNSIRNFIFRRRAFDLYGEAPDSRIVIECAFDAYEEAFVEGRATTEEVRFTAILSLTMMSASKALLLRGAAQAETLDSACIYSVSQSAAAAVHRILVRGLPLKLKPVGQAKGETLIDTAVVLDFLRTLKRWVVIYGHEPEVQKRISEVIPTAIAQYVLWNGARKN